MNLCWLVPDDHGGGIISVALSCVRQAIAAGHNATLLVMIEPTTGWLNGIPGLRTATLGLKAPATQTPSALVSWLQQNPQDVLFLNGAEESDPVIPFLPESVRCIYVVHDTAARYWQSAIAHESDLHDIVAVSQTVALEFSSLLETPTKLRVIYNGSILPPMPDPPPTRVDDLVFLGGNAHAKGAFDVLKLWPLLIKQGFSGRLHWFGALDPSFEKRIVHLPAADRILRPGRVQRDTIFTAAAASKVMLMLSRVEPFGMATVEAMGMGCVPVAWDVATGTKEIVTPQTGLFAPLGDYPALARQVLHACAEYSTFGPPAALRARQVFCEEAMWRRYAELLADLASSTPRPHSLTGQTPPAFVPVRRRYQLLPAGLRQSIRNFIGRSPRLGYLLRDLRGL